MENIYSKKALYNQDYKRTIAAKKTRNCKNKFYYIAINPKAKKGIHHPQKNCFFFFSRFLCP